MPISRTIPVAKTPDVITYNILTGGNEIPKSIGIIQIDIHKEINKIPYAKIRICDGDPSSEDFPISNEDYFIPGKEVEIKLGYRSDNISLFKGIITSHSNRISKSRTELIVECKDKAVKLTIGRKSKHYENITDSDIAEDIIGQSGLTSDIESTSTLHTELIQYNATDWDFMLSRIDFSGRICLVSDGKITIKKPDFTAASVLDLLYGATIIEYQAEINSRSQLNEVSALSWDYSSQTVNEETANEPQFNDAGNIPGSDLADVIGLDNYKLTHSGKLSPEELKEWANAKMQKSRLAKIRGYVKFQGFHGVLPGDIISLNGVGERFNGPVFANSIHHELSDGDWITEVKFGLSEEWFTEIINPYHPSAQKGINPSVQGLQIGKVTDLEDPEGEFRVKVKLPVVSNDEEGIWMRIATLDAGKDRGTFFRPEIDDEVIVGFIFNDPSHPVILGMLHSSSLTAPLSASNTNPEKGYVSREQIKMIFNDEEKSYKLETPGGKIFTLDDNGSIIKIEDESGNSIKMESSGVTIESASSLKIKAGSDITIEGVNITLKPSSQFSLSASGSELKAGPGSAEFKSASIKIDGSGITEIKGGIVKIN
ncbi:MAG: type VI secretion system tip protein VgrG [Ignavibacteriae bacterium]|nr:MAG: type VI secretion system tip protein VgrG [Ignavibacteriota bacterium]